MDEEALRGSLRHEILSQTLTPITWWSLGRGLTDFSGMLSLQAVQTCKRNIPRKNANLFFIQIDYKCCLW